MSMNLLADENLEYCEYFFGAVESKAGRKITPEDVKNKTALLVRSVTQVNEHLLHGSQVQFVGSATIGTDHLDIDYLQQQGITWTNAQGCNAQAVAEYVITALYQLQSTLLDQSITLGIIGLGNVGSRLAKLAKLLGWQVKGYDPFKCLDGIENVSFNDVLQRDVISLHVPLTKTGQYPTYHLLNEQAFAMMNPQAILINSARGEVVQEQALLADIQRTQRQVVLDVFEYEPTISQQVIDAVSLVTPHIAGYSLEGKARGTEMIYQAFCQKFGLSTDKSMTDLLPQCPPLFNPQQSLNQQLKQHLATIYPIVRDDSNLRQALKNGQVNADDFDALRKHYALRREWSAYGFVG